MTVTAGKFDEYILDDAVWGIEDEEFSVDWGDVSRFALAMSMRAAAGIHGPATKDEEEAWMDIAEQGISLAYEFQHAGEQKGQDE